MEDSDEATVQYEVDEQDDTEAIDDDSSDDSSDDLRAAYRSARESNVTSDDMADADDNTIKHNRSYIDEIHVHVLPLVCKNNNRQ